MIAGFSKTARIPPRSSAFRTSAPTATDGAPAPILPLGPGEVPRHAVRLLVHDPRRDAPELRAFAELPRLLRRGDLLVVNDAATLPGSLRGATERGAAVELRLSGAPDWSGEESRATRSHARLRGVLFGAGDHTAPTERRPPPPPLAPGDRLRFGDAARAPQLDATVLELRGRLVTLLVALAPDELWAALYQLGAPVQYAHRREPLPLWSVQTAYAARPWAAEMPSAGRPLSWSVLLELRAAGVDVAALTHAAGLSSTGEPALDAALPWPERYHLPERTARAVAETRGRGGRVIAVGTTVVRALEASHGRPGAGLATLRLGATSSLRVVDGVVSGLHVPGESHFELLTAFAPREPLLRALALAAAHGLSSHELGDACLVLRAPSI